MPVSLHTPEVITQKVATVKITDFINSAERGEVEIAYITLLDDGTPYQRGMVRIEGYSAVKAFYAELNTKLATQAEPDFEAASKALLYEKVMAETGMSGTVA